MSLRCAFLRGLNVGGHRVAMTELAASFEALGASRVATYIASGNVIFEDPRPSDALTPLLEAHLEATLGYAVPVFLREAAELEALVAADPFEAEALAAAKGKPQVIFTREPLSPAAGRRVMKLSTPAERLVLADKAIHWLPANGVGRAELDFRTLAKETGQVTVRTQNTVTKILAKYFG